MESAKERLEGLKRELEIVKGLQYVALDVKAAAIKYINHEIWCIEERDQ